MKLAAPEVKVGQVWKDNDKRGPDRYLKVRFIEDGKASCSECTQEGLVDYFSRSTKISLSRFRPTSNGYRLISEEIK